MRLPLGQKIAVCALTSLVWSIRFAQWFFSFLPSFRFLRGDRRANAVEEASDVDSHYERAGRSDVDDAATVDDDRGGVTHPVVPLVHRSGKWHAPDGSVVRFRGVNLPAKTPSSPPQLRGTIDPTLDLYKHKKDVSFVGRPFDLDDAPTHFRRLSQWGCNLLRLIVTWEAVMHEGPGMIDADYLTYLSKLVALAGEWGLYVIVDPHQDVWSRFTGGDGAPWWTLDAAGFKTDDASLHESGGASLHQHWEEFDAPALRKRPRGWGYLRVGGESDQKKEWESPPRMMWTTNYGRMVTATMFTLFFAGDVYAPSATVPSEDEDGGGADREEESVQSYLQRHYRTYLSAVASTLRSHANVLGFGSLNEPSNGFVGHDHVDESLIAAPMSYHLSAYDAIRLGSGECLDVAFYESPFVYCKTVALNPREISVWKTPRHDVWRNEGVYDVDESSGKLILKKPHHFRLKDGRTFLDAFMKPFYLSVRETIADHNPDWVVYAEPNIDLLDPTVPDAAPLGLDPNRFAWAPHWYDAVTLFYKSYSSWMAFDVDLRLPLLGRTAIDWAFRRSLGSIKKTGGVRRRGERAAADGNGKPTSPSSTAMHVLLGETGVPFDMHSGDCHSANDYADPTAALDRTLRAMERNDLDYTLWNYDPDNTCELGDRWNGEDLSLRIGDDDDVDDAGRGGSRNRGLKAAVRPFVHRIRKGWEVSRQGFDSTKTVYEVEIFRCEEDGDGDGGASASRDDDEGSSVALYVPSLHYSDPVFRVSSGKVEHDRSRQRAVWTGIQSGGDGGSATLSIREGSSGSR